MIWRIRLLPRLRVAGGFPSKHAVWLLAVLTLHCGQVLAREKTDVLHMKNGDSLTGEIRLLEHGKLRLGTDYMGEVSIEWDDVASVESDFEFQFEGADGIRVTGTIKDSGKQEQIALLNDRGVTRFAHQNVVRISPIEDAFWDRLKGSMTFGYSYTKASNVAQGNLGFRATHRTKIRSLTIDGSTILTRDQSDEGTQRSNLQLSTSRYRDNRWFNSYLMGFESSDELGLNLRSSVGAALGRYITQTNTSEFALLGGLVATAESFRGDTSSKENIEGLIGVDYSRYVYDSPSVDLSSRFSAYPSLTEKGRYRTQLDISLRWEVISDLFWDFSYYNTYDSDPPSDAASGSDRGVVTSLGWSF
ncbi:MAG: hypothetical protein ACI87W_001122 [Halieaceae bacterium]|jgi:hypothetical protein